MVGSMYALHSSVLSEEEQEINRSIPNAAARGLNTLKDDNVLCVVFMIRISEL
jgi:hypothetical protein